MPTADRPYVVNQKSFATFEEALEYLREVRTEAKKEAVEKQLEEARTKRERRMQGLR